MFNKSVIDNFISLAENNGDNDIIEMTDPSRLRIFLLEMKMQIDRWNTVTKFFIFNSRAKDYVLDAIKNINIKDNRYSMWGSDIYFVGSIPIDKVLALSITPISSRDIALGKLDAEHMKKLWDLKSFW